jgi:endogenous inhibitor of DNA gyrase (YacG/DUF329 family)
MNSGVKGSRVIRCPGCGGTSIYAPDNPYRPFCSARCKNNDFGAWASEGYAVPEEHTDPAQPDAAEADRDSGKSPPH